MHVELLQSAFRNVGARLVRIESNEIQQAVVDVPELVSQYFDSHNDDIAIDWRTILQKVSVNCQFCKTFAARDPVHIGLTGLQRQPARLRLASQRR